MAKKESVSAERLLELADELNAAACTYADATDDVENAYLLRVKALEYARMVFAIQGNLEPCGN